MSNWSPKPRRPVSLEGIFSHGVADEVHINKSKIANRWQKQRQADGSPHTRPGHSALAPSDGPKLRLNDLEPVNKAHSAKPKIDPEDVIKAFLNMEKGAYAAGKQIGAKVTNAATSTASSMGATSAKSVDEAADAKKSKTPLERDKMDAADEMEKSLNALRKYIK